MCKTKHMDKWLRFWLRTTLWEHKQVLSWTKFRRYEKCKCKCWTIKWVNKNHLKEWVTTNCWCKKISDFIKRQTTHWDTKTKLYCIYSDIKDRCGNPKSKYYGLYWWRWIKCIWNSYEEFKKDMWEDYYKHQDKYWCKGTTIDRIDVNWNYCKENCRWATWEEQSFNRRNNRREMWNWELMSISEIYKKANPIVSYDCFISRYYKLKRPLVDCLYAPSRTLTKNILNNKK